MTIPRLYRHLLGRRKRFGGARTSAATCALRGKLEFWNFLPPHELDELLCLFQRVTRKTLVISLTFGVEGRKLLTPDDAFDPVHEINALYKVGLYSHALAGLGLRAPFSLARCRFYLGDRRWASLLPEQHALIWHEWFGDKKAKQNSLD